MIIELGHFALILALAVALYQFIVPMVGAYTGNRRMMRAAVPASLLQLILIFIAMLALTHAYVVSDFSVLNVFMNSHSEKPMLYKISGVWANHEGSMLLWVLILALFGAAVGLFSGNLPLSLRARVLSVQASISIAFLAFILFTSNPFIRLVPVPIQGQGLNPLLQDPALAFHPPFLYAGYVGLSIAYSFAIAALLEGRVDAAWARWVRPWTLLAWMFLTLGISMGSWWAYYELGWGGWWFWDPVENASLMPWLLATALIHSSIVVEKRNALKIWTILLAIMAFSLSLLGTFMVRSGVLTSVHAFAVDPKRGIFILGILLFFIGVALALFAWRAPALKTGGVFAPVSREGGIVLNNLFLCAAATAVIIGTLYPLLHETFTSSKISVGPPYFNLTFGLIIIPLLLLVPIGPMLSWKRSELRPALKRLSGAALLAIIVGLIVAVIYVPGALTNLGDHAWALLSSLTPKIFVAAAAVAMGCWLIFASAQELFIRIGLFKVPLKTSLHRLIGLPRAAIGMVLAHAGLGVTVLGIIAISLWRLEAIVAMNPGDKQAIGSYVVQFVSEAPYEGPNFSAEAGTFRITRNDHFVAEVISEKRDFKPKDKPTTEVGLYRGWLGQVYVAMGDRSGETARVVRIYYNPYIVLIWYGALIMFFGGLLSLSDRRYRVGAPKRQKVPAGVPAE